MTGAARNIHATGVVLGTTGFLFVGPSGSGKTMTALSCMAAAQRAGQFSALIGDDQVLVSVVNGCAIARGPASIRGLCEIRGAGIVTVDTVPSAVLSFAVQPMAKAQIRLPPEDEILPLHDHISLPLLRLPYGDGIDSYALLCRLLPQIAQNRQ